MLTQDQQNTIGGESVFTFDTTIGIDNESVIVRLSYEYDASGTFNEAIDTVRSESGYPIMGYLDESTIDELCMLGCKLLTEKEIY